MTTRRIVFVISLAIVAACQAGPTKKIIVTNPVQIVREHETISLDWVEIQKALPDLNKENAAVMDLKTNQLLVIQIAEDQKGAELLFQADFGPGEKKEFTVMVRQKDTPNPVSPMTTFCRFIPERKDDFGWENDKVAFRMYGPALEYETITSGIDAWGKCVTHPIIDKFIRDYVEKKIPYHYDHGEGGDFYKVGNTLGCGGLAPFVDNKVCLPRNFVEWKVLANGPIRSRFELSYKPWKAGAFTLSETKRISLDLGSNLSRVECRYTCKDTDVLPLAAGIILRENSTQTWTGDQSIAYWLPTDFIQGNMACGVVFGSNYKTQTLKADGHLLLTLNQEIKSPAVYYAGSCWDKNKEFDTFEKWQKYLADFKQRLDNPIVIEIQK